MFSYYGSKSKIINKYPAPLFDKIIEPFAGSARYSLKFYDRDILLIEKYEFIYRIWKWLQECEINDILNIPEPNPREDIREYKFDCKEAEMLCRFMIGGGLSSPQWIVSPQGFGNGVKSSKKRIAANLFKIKDWEIVHSCYTKLDNEKATWFIDAPYQFGGHKYVHSNKSIDFEQLSKWCKSRLGQVIVCENSKANWMNFVPISDMQGSYRKSVECLWSNYLTDYDNEQQRLAI